GRPPLPTCSGHSPLSTRLRERARPRSRWSEASLSSRTRSGWIRETGKPRRTWNSRSASLRQTAGSKALGTRPRESAAVLRAGAVRGGGIEDVTLLAPFGLLLVLGLVPGLAAFIQGQRRAGSACSLLGLRPPGPLRRVAATVAVCLAAALVALAASRPVVREPQARYTRTDAE